MQLSERTNAAPVRRDWLLHPSGMALSPIRVIMLEVCAAHGLTYQQLIGPRRHSHYVAARHEGYYRCYKETEASLAAIARAFNKDRSSITWGIARYEEKRGDVGNER